MDEIKLLKWREDFNLEVEKIQIEFDLSFKETQITDAFMLYVDDESQILSLQIADKDLPTEIIERLNHLLITTKPEDSI